MYPHMNKQYANLYKKYLREAILLDGEDKEIFKADCNNEYHGIPDDTGYSFTVLWGIAPLLCGHVSMLDTDEEKVKRVAKLYDQCDVRVGDIRKMPYEDNTFDVVLDYSTLDHLELESWWRALEEYKRVLKPGGNIVLVEWTKPFNHADGNLVFYHKRSSLDRMIRKRFAVESVEVLIKELNAELVIWRATI